MLPPPSAEVNDPAARALLQYVASGTDVEETARHAGHADIIREALDGTQGM